MLHAIKPEQHGPLGEAMANAVQACVHCGFCLAVCPTYQELGQEMDTPRGRIVLMKQVLEGTLSAESAKVHIDRCLGCLACEPACPSGVPYRDLISPYRATVQKDVRRSLGERWRRYVAAQTIPHPKVFRAALAGANFARKFEGLVPSAMKPMLDMAPREVPPAEPLDIYYVGKGPKRGRVALLAGCAQQVLDPDINVATVEVLRRNGVDVVVPFGQGCCGGLSWHTGDLEAARAHALRNLHVFPTDYDAILTNAAGCGSAMHEYHLMFKGTEHEARAETFRKKVMDVSVYLNRLGLEPPTGWRKTRTIAYHDACHLANAQGVRLEPRALLQSIPGVELCEVASPHVCCGSAGTYNIDQPAIAASLGQQKAQHVTRSGASIVATGNIGCMTQLRVHLEKSKSPVQVRHTVQILRDAYVSQG